MFRRLTTVVLALFFVGLGAEITARVDDRIRFGTPLNFGGDIGTLRLADSLTVRGRPNASFKHFRLNKFGFRGPEIAASTAPGCVRIMLLGASETFGFTEPPGKEYPAQLADSLRPHGCFEVVNAGIMGITGPNVIRFWEQWGRRFKPVVVIFYPTPRFYLSNDAPKATAPRPAATSVENHPWQSRIIDRIHDRVHYPERIQGWRSRRILGAMAVNAEPGWVFDEVPSERLRQFRNDLDSLVIAVRATGADPVVLSHATRFGQQLTASDLDVLASWRLTTPRATETTIVAFERQAAAVTKEVASRRRVHFIDIAEEFKGRDSLFVDASHFTPMGSALMARFLRDSVLVWFGKSHAQP